MRNRMFASVCVLLIGLNLLVVWYGERKRVQAQEPPQHWVVYSDGNGRVIKIQDGSCSLYVSITNAGAANVSHTAIATGQGCK